jgi:hypothetical protein
METQQLPPNQNTAETKAQPQQTSSKNNFFLVVAISVLLTAITSGSVVYFWQNSTNEKETSSLEQKISSLEEQLPTTNKTKVTPQPSPSTELSPTSDPSATPKTYSNEKYGFSFDYPQSWVIEQKDGDRASFSSIADDHTISVMVWRVTGFGYCYKYGERKEIVVGGKTAETADGVGGTEMCDQPEEYANRGNTFVLIPLEDKPGDLRNNQIHISYDYPIGDKGLVKSNLDQILSTFKFAD